MHARVWPDQSGPDFSKHDRRCQEKSSFIEAQHSSIIQRDQENPIFLLSRSLRARVQLVCASERFRQLLNAERVASVRRCSELA
jgi:hypothetical protein